MNTALTGRQEQALLHIQDWIYSHGYPPTLRELGGLMGIRSTNGVNDHLRALERKGKIEVRRGGAVARSIKLLGQAAMRDPGELVEVRVLGVIRPDSPVFTEENVVDVIRIDPKLVPQRDVFGLRVSGDAMHPKLFAGDYALVHQKALRDPGDLVVAMLGDAACVRYFWPEQHRVRFTAELPGIPPLFVSNEHFRREMILGKVVGMVRRV